MFDNVGSATRVKHLTSLAADVSMKTALGVDKGRVIEAIAAGNIKLKLTLFAVALPAMGIHGAAKEALAGPLGRLDRRILPGAPPTALILLVAAAIAAPACFGEACQPEDLATLEAQRHAEIAFACVGFTSTPDAGAPTDCPELPAINEKYRKLREEWVSCQR